MQGTRFVGSTNMSGLIVVEMSDLVTLQRPNLSPLTTFMMSQPSETVSNMKFEHLEDDYLGNSAVITAGADTGTTINVATGTGTLFCAGDIFTCPTTGENIYVSSVATDALTVIRAYGSVSATAIDAGDTVYLIGSTATEGGDTRTLKSTIPSNVYNYCQDFQTPFGESDILTSTTQYQGDSRVHLQKMKMGDHKLEINRTMLFGQKKVTAATTGNIWATGGLLEGIATNIKDLGGQPLTDKALIDWVAMVKPYVKGKMVAYCSTNFLSAVSLLAGKLVRLEGADTVYGFDVQKLRTPHGVVNLVEDMNLTGTVYGNYAVLTDTDSTKWVTFSGPKVTGTTKLRANVQNPGVHYWKDEYRTIGGLRMRNEKANAVLRNFTY